MQAADKNRGGLLAAGLLAVLTLAVFLASQYGGPATAVTRYHSALLAGDGQRVAAVCKGGLTNPDTTALDRYVARFFRAGATVQLAKTVKSNGRASVLALYRGQGWVSYMSYELDHSEGVWMIDPRKTLSATLALQRQPN